jgi:hypothetical protein
MRISTRRQRTVSQISDQMRKEGNHLTPPRYPRRIEIDENGDRVVDDWGFWDLSYCCRCCEDEDIVKGRAPVQALEETTKEAEDL